MYFSQENKYPKKKKKFKLHSAANGEEAGGRRRKCGAGGAGGGWYHRGCVAKRRAHGLGLFLLFQNELLLETPPEAAASRIHLKSTVDSAQGSVGAANANQVYNHQHGRGEKGEEKNNPQVLQSTHSQGRTHTHKHTKGRRGRGARRAREREEMFAKCWLEARCPWPERSGRRAGSAARCERHDGGRGPEPIFWRGSWSDAILRPRAGRAPSLCLFFTFLLRRVDVSRPTPSDFLLYLLLSDFCLLCVPTQDRPGTRVGTR